MSRIFGGLAAFALIRLLYPGFTAIQATDVVVPHQPNGEPPVAVNSLESS
jgi:hypothetical protein